MSSSQIKQQIATLLETDPSKITIKLTNKPDENDYNLLSALLEKHDCDLSLRHLEVVLKELINKGSDFTIVVSKGHVGIQYPSIKDLPSIFRSGRRSSSSEVN